MKYNPFLIQAQHRERVSELSKRGIVSPLAEQLAQYGENMLIHLEGLTWEEAHFLRQTMQACGGEAIFSGHPGDELEALLLATRSQLELALQRLSNEEHRMYAAAEEIREALAMREQLDRRRRLVCGSHVLPLGERTLVMGILNVTPDSFSDGGRYIDLDQAVAQARHMVEAGADLIDIGGESTRPGSEPVDAAEELDRVLPIIRALSAELQVPLSIDTYKAEVADRAVQAGAHIINDIWGAKRDKRMAEVAARHQVPIILMHNREDRNYQHFFANFVKDLRESVQIALQAGVRHDQIILDPGIGFAKSLEQNLETMRRLDDLVGLGFPVLLATSRKSMIGHVLDLPVDERMEGTAATVALGVAKGCHMVRVHDVKEMKRVTTMMDAMVKEAYTLDKIYFSGMSFYGYHGVFAAEAELGQRFYVDLALSVDLSKAGASDDLNDTINYAEIFSSVQQIVEGQRFKLVEALTANIAEKLLRQFPLAEVKVKVTKPNPPINGHYDSVAIEMTRKREDFR